MNKVAMFAAPTLEILRVDVINATMLNKEVLLVITLCSNVLVVFVICPVFRNEDSHLAKIEEIAAWAKKRRMTRVDE
jgi:hypothetical protein